MHPLPTVASDLSSTYQFITSYCQGSGTVSYSTTICLHAAFPSPVLPPGLPCTEATPMPAQEPVLTFPFPAPLDALAEHSFDGTEHRARTPAVPYAPSLLRLGDATTKGSPSVRLRLDHAIRLYHPHRCRPPSACRASTGHRSRW